MSEPDKPWTWGDQPPQPAKHPLDLHPEGTRFLATGYDADMHVFAQGDWVRYADYARLKAECQARQAENSVLAVECDSLKAEVERLTNLKSGADFFKAKEGKQS